MANDTSSDRSIEVRKITELCSKATKSDIAPESRCVENLERAKLFHKSSDYGVEGESNQGTLRDINNELLQAFQINAKELCGLVGPKLIS